MTAKFTKKAQIAQRNIRTYIRVSPGLIEIHRDLLSLALML